MRHSNTLHESGIGARDIKKAIQSSSIKP